MTDHGNGAEECAANETSQHPCFEKLSQKLAESNTRLVGGIAWEQRDGTIVRLDRVIFIETEKIESRKRQGPTRVTASYCPFCGSDLAAPTSARANRG